MAYLIRDLGVVPNSIVGITFTRAAANEMRIRLAQLVQPDQAKQVKLHTFHALAYRIVSEAQGRPSVLGQREQQGMARQLLREFQLNADQNAVEGLLTDFAFFAGTQVPVERFQTNSCEPNMFFGIWTRYGQMKTEAGVTDFDDLIIVARDLMKQNSSFRQRQAGRVRHLLVDEFQDTNALQWEFLQLLLPAGNNIMVVGDDDQAIYGWRGASPRFMLEFPKHFPGCATMHLTKNFRSTASIIKPAEQLINSNAQRFQKSFVAARGKAQPPVFTRPASPAEEADQITHALAAQLQAGVSAANLAVLYRVHLLAFPLMNRLERAGIAFRVIGGRPNPFTRWMARDILAYLRWSYGEASMEEIVRVLRRPFRRDLTKELVQQLAEEKVETAGVLDWLAERVSPAGMRDLNTLRGNLTTLTHTPTGRVITFIRSDMGYDDYIDQYCRWSGSDPQEARDVLSAIEQVPSPTDSSRVYIELAEQEERRGEDEDSTVPAVTLASFHGSKGLEWDQVWLLSSVEGAIPYRQAIASGSQAVMEEERRLFYVGMTRAKDLLTISAPRQLFGSDVQPSRFVVEAGIWSPPPPPQPRQQPRPVRKRKDTSQATPVQQQNLPPVLPRGDYAEGILCYHAKFGKGVIDRVHESQGIVEVWFPEIHATKTLSIDACVSEGFLRLPRE